MPTRADSVGAVSDLVGDSTFGLLSGDSSLGFFSGDSDLGFLVGGGTSSSSVAEALSSSLTDASVPLSSPPPSTDFSAVGSPAGVAGDRGASGSGEASALRMGQRLDHILKRQIKSSQKVVKVNLAAFFVIHAHVALATSTGS